MRLFQEIADACEAAGIGIVLIGGHAVNHYGCSRFTMDVDLLIAVDRSDDAARAFKQMGFSETHRSEILLRFEHADDSVPPVDLLLVDEPTFGKVALGGHAIQIEDRQFLIPAVDVLISMKLHALRFGRQRLVRDGGDIVSLLMKTGRKPEDIAELVATYGTPEIMKEIRFLYDCESRG